MTRRRAPETAAGYYVLHDFRRVDWPAWQARSEEEREAIAAEAVEFLESEAETEEGDLACFSVMGHKADLLIIAMRERMADLDTFERQLHNLELSTVTERTTSAIGVTEASGYTEGARAFFDEDTEMDPGLERYMHSRLYPTLPDAEFVSFYFMNKRRGPEANWYDLPYEERVEHITRHGEIGREYAGRVTQIITGTTGFDDWEWGVTLFANDMVAIKDLLVDMRFDQSTSLFAEFGSFYVGRQFAPSALGDFFAGEPVTIEHEEEEADPALSETVADLDLAIDVPADAHAVVVRSDAEEAAVREEVDGLRGNFEHYDSHLGTETTTQDGTTVTVSLWTTDRAADTAAGFLEELPGTSEVLAGPIDGEAREVSADGEATEEVRAALEAEGVYAGVPHGEDVHALVLYSEADREEFREAVEQLADGFDRYDTHEGTSVYESVTDEALAVASLWATEDAAETAAGYLEDLPAIVEREDDDVGFSTMGMFYEVDPAYREEFRETFGEVGELLADMEGHRETTLFANVENPNDMFIASHWRERDDALEFFRSDAFGETVDWGRDVLVDRPRHVFLT